jgi:hypothetical protein
MLVSFLKALGVPFCAVKNCSNPAITRVAVSSGDQDRMADLCPACLGELGRVMAAMGEDLQRVQSQAHAGFLERLK